MGPAWLWGLFVAFEALIALFVLVASDSSLVRALVTVGFLMVLAGALLVRRRR